MKQSNTDTLANSTINIAGLEKYLFTFPRYMEAGVKKDVSEPAIHFLGHLDAIEWWLKRYVGGKTKTLHRLFYEIRAFQQCNDKAARKMTAFALKVVGDHLLQQEYYELMPRYQIACQRIDKAFNIQPAISTEQP